MFRPTVFGVVSSTLLFTGVCLSADQPAKKSSGSKEPKPTASKTPDETSRIASKIHVEPVAKLTDREAKEVALCGSRIIKHVVQARDALQRQDQAAATTHLQQVSKLLAIIDSVLPRYKVTTEIKSGEHVYHDEDEFTTQYITLFEELERRDILTPVAQAKRAAEQKTADRGKADEEGPMAVTHADVEMSAVRLNLALTHRMLAVAEKLVDEKKFQQADLQLMMLLARGVVFIYDEIDLPLEEAADNLKLAELELKDGRRNEAKAALHVAIDQLKAYEKKVGENRGKEIQALHQEIEKLMKELGEGEATEESNKEHAATVEDWWHQVTMWFRKASPAH